MANEHRLLEEAGWLAALSSIEILKGDLNDLLNRVEDVANSPYELQYSLAEIRYLASAAIDELNEAKSTR